MKINSFLVLIALMIFLSVHNKNVFSNSHILLQLYANTDTLKLADFQILYMDSVTVKQQSDQLIFSQKITERHYVFCNDTLFCEFTDYGLEELGLDTMPWFYTIDDQNIALLAINSYTPATNSNCGGAWYFDIGVFIYNDLDGLREVGRISFDSCLGEILIDGARIGKHKYLEQIFWEKDAFLLKGNDIEISFQLKTLKWKSNF